MKPVNADWRALPAWLLVLCALLLVWQPISFALTASTLVDRVAIGGAPLAAILVARVLVTALGIAAGLALIRRRPAAVTLAKTALVASAGMDLIVYTTPYVPNDRAPGDTPIYVAASLLYHAAWLAYLWRSTRVGDAFGGDRF